MTIFAAGWGAKAVGRPPPWLVARRRPGQNLHRGPNAWASTQPRDKRRADPLLLSAPRRRVPNWVANTNTSEVPETGTTNVKKRSKLQRRAAKAAANRTRETLRAKQGATGRAKKRPPPPPASLPLAAPPQPARRCSTFAAFEEAFAAFEARAAAAKRQGRCFTVAEVPRPPSSDVLGAARAASATEWRRLCHRALLRWHPDKWQPLAASADDGPELARLTQAMTRAVLRAKERGYAP